MAKKLNSSNIHQTTLQDENENQKDKTKKFECEGYWHSKIVECKQP